jgi:hypothetical protein
MPDGTAVGTIELDLKIPNSAVQREITGLKKAFSNADFTSGMEKSMSRLNLGSGLKRSLNGISKSFGSFISNSISKASSGVKSFGDAGASSNERVSQSAGKMNSQYDKTQEKIREINSELGKLDAKMDSISSKYSGFPAIGGMSKSESMSTLLGQDTEYQKLSGEAAKLEAKLDPLRDKSSRLSDALSDTDGAAKKAKFSFSGLGKVFGGVGKMFGGVGKIMGKVFGTAGNVAKKMVGSLFNISRGSNSASGSVSGLSNAFNRMSRTIVRNIFVYGMVIKGLKSMMSYMWSALKTNSQFTSSLNMIKTNLLVAFQPIYEAILPALNALMSAVARATTFIASAISALFGKTYKQSFAGAKSLNNAVKSIGGIGGAAEKTGKKAKKAGKQAKKAGEEAKRALAPFDEINQLSLGKDEGAGDTPDIPSPGGSGAGSGLFAQLPSGAELFDGMLGDPYAIGKSVAEWMARGLASIDWGRIKEHAAKAGRNIALFINGGIDTPELWHQLGRTLSEGINTVATFAESFADTLNWSGLGKSLSDGLDSAIHYWDPQLSGRAIYKSLNGIREVIYSFFVNTDWGAFGAKLADGLNTIVYGLDMNMIGRSFASKWNALVDFIHDFVSNFDWSELGTRLSDGVNGWFDEIDWTKAGETLSNGVKGILKAINTFIMETDWFEIGKSLANILENIDYGGIISLLMEGLGAALAGLGEFIWGIIDDAWQDVVDWWQDVAYDDGDFTIQGLLKGIGDALKNVGQWIKDNIFQPFIDGFKGAFDINSPSKVMDDMGGYLMDGLFNGISRLVDKVLGPFKDVKDGVIDAFGEMGEFIDGITDDIGGFFKSMVNGVIKALNFMIGGLNKINVDVPDWVPGLGGKSLGFNIPKIPMLAKGGIIDQPTLAMVGEKGKEAVVPLENSKEIEKLALKMAEALGGTRNNDRPIDLTIKFSDATIKKTIKNINRQSRINGTTAVTV